VKTSDSTKAIDAVLFEVQKEALSAIKGKRNEHLKSSYADLGQVWSAIRPTLTERGLLVRQSPNSEGGEIVVLTTRIIHIESGEFIEDTLAIKPVKYDPQMLGSAITYARRYALCTMLGVIVNDDDGHNASRPPSTGRAVPPKNPSDPATITKGETIEMIRKWAGIEKAATADIASAVSTVKRKLGVKGEAKPADFARIAKFVGDCLNDKTDFIKWAFAD